MDEERTMTIKQIAEVCQVDERTIQRWVSLTGDKMSSINDKMSLGSSTHPASFTLEETITIVRAGGRGTLADLLQDNAAKTATEKPSIDYAQLATVVAMAVAAAFKQAPAAPASYHQGNLSLPSALLEGEYYTIKGYGARRGIRITATVAVQLGREAAVMSRDMNIEIKQVPDDQWGQVNSYHISVLKKVLTI